MAKIYGWLEKAQFENLGADPSGGGLSTGRVWFRTDLSTLWVYDGAAKKKVLFQPFSTFALPSSDGTSGQFLKTDGSGNLSFATAPGTVGSSSGSSTDNCIARFDGTGGTTIQNSGVVIDDSNNITGIGQITFSTIASASADTVGTTMTATGANAVANTRTRSVGTTSVAAGGFAISSSSGLFSVNTGSFTNVTNLAVSLTTTGRPVKIMLIPDGSNEGALQAAGSGGVAPSITIRIKRDGTTIGDYHFANSTTTSTIYIPVSSIQHVDQPSAGSHSYVVQALNNGGVSCTAGVQYAQLCVFEL